jgi:protein-disulfide isomerase
MKRFLPFIIIIAVLLGTGLVVYLKSRPQTLRSPRVDKPSVPNAPSGEPKLGASPPHQIGADEAPVLLEEFGDFQCAACASLHAVLKALEAEFGSRIVIVFRQFPLSSHAHALEAARASEAAGLQGKFWEMHDLLYENQAAWKDAAQVAPIFDEYATRIGLNLDQFKRDVSSQAVTKRLQLDRERGSWIGVNSTPTIFLNGREVPFESLSREKLSALIRADAHQ